MKIFADQLERMDDFFSTKQESEKWLIIIGIGFLIAFLSFSYFYPYAKKQYDRSQAEKQRLQKSIAESKNYLDSISRNGDRDYKVKEYDMQIASKKSVISDLNKKIVYIQGKIEELTPLLFNEKSWSNFINSISETARINDVDVRYITNKYVTGKESFGHVLEVTFGGRSGFSNLVHFVHDIEQNDLVTDIYASQFSGTSEGVNADINISVWGVNH
jgi:hypothetical protein